MRPSAPPPVALVAVLLFAVFIVLLADILAISAAADPLPASSGTHRVSPYTIHPPRCDTKRRARHDHFADVPGCLDELRDSYALGLSGPGESQKICLSRNPATRTSHPPISARIRVSMYACVPGIESRN